MKFTVEVKGTQKLIREARNGFGVGPAVEKGIRKGSVIVEATAKKNVHKLSRKLHDSTGHFIEGHGLETEGHVGPRPGYGQPRSYTTMKGAGQRYEVAGRVYIDTTRKKRRKVRAINRGDPQEYAAYEELGTRYRPPHPWLEPALTENEDRIQRAVDAAIREALKE